MIDIAYAANHGFAARMLMQTDLLGHLVAAGLRVALIAPDGQDANLRAYCQAKGVALYEFSPPASRWQAECFRARKYLLDDIKANPCLWERHVRATRYGSKMPWKQARPRLYYLLYKLRRRFPGIRRWYQKREEKLLNNEEALALIRHLQPKVFVSTYPVNFTEGMLQAAARKLGCLSVIHLLSWDNITGKGTFMGLADHYLMWGQVMREELMAYYQVPDEKIQITGVPHFDRHVVVRDAPAPAAYLAELGLNPDRPYLFFGMSSFHASPREIDVVEWLAGKVGDGSFGGDMQLVVRPHPQNISGGLVKGSWLPRLKTLASEDRIGVCYPQMVDSGLAWSMRQDDMEKLVQLIAGSSIVYNSGSTITIDAMMCDRPVIMTAFDADEQVDYWHSARRLMDYVHLKKITNQTGVEKARSFAELAELTKAYLSNPHRKHELRRATVAAYCDNYDEGKATRRVVSALKKIASKTPVSV